MKKLSRNFFIVLAGALVIIGILSILFLYMRLSRIGEEEVLHSLSKAAAQTAINLNDRMDSIDEIMNALLYDARFQESVHRAPEEETLENQFAEIRPLREALASAADNRYIAQIRIFLNDQKMITREGVNFFGLTDAMDTVEYQEMIRLGVSRHWMGMHSVETVYFSQECLTLGMLYRRSFWMESPDWAMLLFDISPDGLGDVLKTLEMPDEQAMIAIVDLSGKIMLGEGDEATFAEILSASSGSAQGMLDVGMEELAYVVQPLKAEKWSLILYMPKENLLSGQQAMRTMLTILIFGLTLLIVALLIIFALAIYSRKINMYIRNLNKSLKGVANSNKSGTYVFKTIFNIDKNIAELLESNKQLAEEKLNAQLREREVTLQALQAQINPHFLYNTLDSINWMAIRVQAMDVSSAIATLADYFRLSLSKGRSVVSLAEDAEIVRKYLKLYEHRYDNEYNVIWELNSNTLNCLLPKLTLQPLIENALQHGVFKRREKVGGIVRIRSSLEGKKLVLVVMDNGPGISEPIDWNKGYGLGNVRKRLDLYFNNRYELSLDNAAEGGAVVTVKVFVNACEEEQSKEK